MEPQEEGLKEVEKYFIVDITDGWLELKKGIK